MADPVIFQEPNPKAPNECNSLWFEWTTEKNDLESGIQGLPVFDKVLLVHIRGPGLVKSEAVVVCERHKPDGTVATNEVMRQRIGQMIDAFKKGDTTTFAGTPLEELAALDMSTRSSLIAMGVHSIEALAGMNEAAAPSFMGFRRFKMAAQAYLDLRAGQAPIAKLTADLDAANEKNRLLQANYDDLVKRVQALEAEDSGEERRGPGRPRKVA